MTKAKEKFITLKLVKSPIGYNITQKRTLEALKLTKINKTRTLKETPSVRGMVNRVQHLVEVSCEE